MTRVILVGIEPDAVDLSDPALPPDLTAAKIAAGIDATLSDMRGRGWTADFCSIRPDDSAENTIAASLSTRCDCVVIGGGIRIPPSNLQLFERVLNAIHRFAPDAPIAFNTRPENSADAAQRWLDRKPGA
jgi:hypothetical protein